ncbi:MAG: hypothetical protein VR67_14015 [Peptococcaceae bacterium BRH_c8a]|nr:MAG: hypothetical protein VR67_14015 [Peptococcaceae bacterium BRH_c8a]
MPGIYEYKNLTLPELRMIDPAKTICLMTVSPLEVHGPHLPLGTDVLVGEKLQREYCKAILERYPGYGLLVLPALYAGCDPLPVKGSITVRARTLENLLYDYVSSLAGQGFRYLIICDNHGGPSHQLAMEICSQRVWSRYHFALINPFNVLYRRMVQNDHSFLNFINLIPGRCGDNADAHAGTNETSLALASGITPTEGYKELPPGEIPRATGLAAILGRIGNIMGRFGFTQTKAELKHLENMLAWVNSPNELTYLGTPGLATVAAGEQMLKGHIETTLTLLGQALAGKKPCTRPMLWWMRAFRR